MNQSDLERVIAEFRRPRRGMKVSPWVPAAAVLALMFLILIFVGRS